MHFECMVGCARESFGGAQWLMWVRGWCFVRARFEIGFAQSGGCAMRRSMFSCMFSDDDDDGEG